MQVSVSERAWLLRQLHVLAGRRAPDARMAFALMGLGAVRTLKRLSVVRGFGRRRRAHLRYALTRPNLEETLGMLLDTLTATPPDVPPIRHHHPLGPEATFPPVVAPRLMMTGQRILEEAPPLDGFPTTHPRILGHRAALQYVPLPRRAVILGGGYVGLELAMGWAGLGVRVQIVEPRRALLAGYIPDLLAPIVADAEAMGITALLDAAPVGFAERGDHMVVFAETWDGVVAVVGDVVVVTLGLL